MSAMLELTRSVRLSSSAMDSYAIFWSQVLVRSDSFTYSATVAAPSSFATRAASHVSFVPRMEQITQSVCSSTYAGGASTNSLLVYMCEATVAHSRSMK